MSTNAIKELTATYVIAKAAFNLACDIYITNKTNKNYDFFIAARHNYHFTAISVADAVEEAAIKMDALTKTMLEKYRKEVN